MRLKSIRATDVRVGMRVRLRHYDDPRYFRDGGGWKSMTGVVTFVDGSLRSRSGWVTFSVHPDGDMYSRNVHQRKEWHVIQL